MNHVRDFIDFSDKVYEIFSSDLPLTFWPVYLKLLVQLKNYIYLENISFDSNKNIKISFKLCKNVKCQYNFKISISTGAFKLIPSKEVNTGNTNTINSITTFNRTVISNILVNTTASTNVTVLNFTTTPTANVTTTIVSTNSTNNNGTIGWRDSGDIEKSVKLASLLVVVTFIPGLVVVYLFCRYVPGKIYKKLDEY